MNAPKEIVMRMKRAPTRDGAAFIPYIERKDGNLFRQPIPSTKYTRSDLVEALVAAVLDYNQAKSKIAEFHRLDTYTRPWKDALMEKEIAEENIETALKALGE